MTPFLVAALLALLVGGGLAVLFREDRRRFRQASAAVVGLLLVAGAYVAWVGGGGGHHGDAAAIAWRDLKLDTVAGSYRVSGVLQNRSPALAVSAVPLRLQVQDCTAAATCRTLHDAGQDLRISVPPGEERAFVLVFPAAPAHRQGTLRWAMTHGAPTVYQPAER